jgi:hypothetical protein
MRETLASFRSPGRPRGFERAGDCSALGVSFLVWPPPAGSGLRDPKDDGLGRRSRFRVIG